mmetsp:Transcript_9644/g.13502  ORF Transcript_9644/g.13502 Transcript_9644/m.13502 type:complete len:563 (+) Transcript_9644:145-1833(+)
MHLVPRTIVSRNRSIRNSQRFKCLKKELSSYKNSNGNGYSVPSWATIDPEQLSESNPHEVLNFLDGKWMKSKTSKFYPDPLNGKEFSSVSEISVKEIEPFVNSLNSCPKSGLHNPFKNPERYVDYGTVSALASAEMRKPDVEKFFARLIQRVAPKSYKQAQGEVIVTRKFLENFSGDSVRYLARSFSNPGDHEGQTSSGYRWPYGPVAVISPFNFPLEIPLLQVMGALYMGNKVLYKGDSRVSVVMEQALKMLHSCGMPVKDLDMINCQGSVMQALLESAQPRMTQFTGSTKIGEILSNALGGRIKLEDSGLDWKILGPDVGNIEYTAWVCDQDAYAFSGQKCSAQSLLFVHENWVKAGLFEKLAFLAKRRNLEELTNVPVLTVNTETGMKHIEDLMKINGTRIIFGGKPLNNKNIPACYGAWEPTAIFVPISELLKDENFSICMQEIFGPTQIVTQYDDESLELVLNACEKLAAHLTASVVSSDRSFQLKVLANTINGVTYCGQRARTTGAPQNHWFGPAGDPRSAGIGTREAIRMVWSCHREIVMDEQSIPNNWTIPSAT